MIKKIIVIGGLLLNAVSSVQAQNEKNYVLFNTNDSDADKIKKAANVTPSKRQLLWQQMELTGFLHFGVNTFTNKEWGDGTESPSIFNPTALDARQWVRVSKEAGIKLVILTAKHHDGFCLWPSAYTEHSVKNSPWKNGQGDVVKEVVEACKEYGVKFGVYLSPWDRNSKFFGDSAKYNDYFINQLTELLSNYGEISEVWFDGANGEGPTGKKQYYDYNRWYTHIRKLQPKAVIAVMGPDVRWVGTESGYGRETEWSVLPADEMVQEKVAANSQQAAGFAPMNLMEDDLGSRAKIVKAKSLVWYPAETDVSIRPGWFYHPAEDSVVKTPEKLLDIYFSSVGRNGVLLLNIPPDKRGLIHEADVKSLVEWKKLTDKTFANNLLQHATIKAKGKKTKALVDGKFNTSWTSNTNDGTAVIDFTFATPQLFDVLMLQEDITKGQRIEDFILEYEVNGEWKVITEGTTVGYKRLIRFTPVTTNRVRLSILQSRAKPVLAEVGLYQQP